ncbi:MAG: symmetrical bis(5'-nucleosyl)-tetraphosphatase [bacterium]
MPTYAIGDIQGCFKTLLKLLEKIHFSPLSDQLWLLGDLVNRGPHSLEVLRWASSHRENIRVVLGNHDLHLLARAAGVTEKKKMDTLDEVLNAPDRDELLDWLKTRPFIHREKNFLAVHAGIHPHWTAEEAELKAQEVEEELRGPSSRDFLASVFQGSKPESLSFEKKRKTVKVLTRIRMCHPDGTPGYEFKGSPDEAPPPLVPWYSFPNRSTENLTFLFGHWAALGLKIEPKLVGLDTGCVWGRALTAYRLEDGAIFQEQKVD